MLVVTVRPVRRYLLFTVAVKFPLRENLMFVSMFVLNVPRYKQVNVCGFILKDKGVLDHV